MKRRNFGVGMALARIALVLSGLIAVAGLEGCLVMGHTSSGGWFVWPGGLGLVLMVLFVVLLLRRR